MARDAPVVVEDTWTELTANDATEVTLAVLSPQVVYVRATTGAAPTTDYGFPFRPGQGYLLLAFLDLAPGLAGADRLWARCESEGAQAVVWVSHA